MKARPELLYDGDCGFCRLWIERARALTGDRIEYAPYQAAAARHSSVPREAFAEAIHLFEPDAPVRRAADAAYRTLSYAPGLLPALPARLYDAFPPFAALSEAAYRFVAARRPLFSWITAFLWGDSVLPRAADGTRRVFLAVLGLCYLAAFASLGVQVRALIGPDGILPAASLLDSARPLGLARFWAIPSLAWLSASGGFLVGLCAAGALASLGLVAGLATGPCAAACWALYLSLSAVGSDFLSFQWDALLLETGLLALLLAPWRVHLAGAAAPSRGALLLVRLLLVKLMLQSGVVKLASGDPSWRDLTALTYHYWSQPLPNLPAWWANLAPLWFQKASCFLLFVIELGAPLLILGPRRARALGAALIAFLMALIMLTGNYGFFNLLALALCAACLDDDYLPDALRPSPAASVPGAKRPGLALVVFACAWLYLGVVQFLPVLGIRPPDAALAPARWASPLRSVNRYGLFAVMTKERDELSIEVSEDGSEWKEWPFSWKPGDPRRTPPFAGPHMPRLDWQMWFAALGDPGHSPWFGNLLFRILDGSPSARALLGPDPLDGRKPAYARAWRWKTRFSTPEERRADGAWWRRERRGLFFPVVSLKPR